MQWLIRTIRSFFELSVFGVCTAIAERFNIPARYIRFNFVYVTLITFGSPILIYFILAFWLNLKQYINRRRNSVWDL